MLSHPQRALSACTTGGILQNPSLILRCFYKGRGRGVFLSLCQFPVETGFQRMVTQGLARSLDGTGTLKARLFPMPLCVTLSGSQENCLHSMSLGSSRSVTPPVKCLLSLSSLNCSPTSSRLLSPPKLLVSTLPSRFFLPTITNLSPVLLISHMLLTCVSCFLQKTAHLLPMWLEMFWKLCFASEYNDLGSDILWSRGFQTLEC